MKRASAAMTWTPRAVKRSAESFGAMAAMTMEDMQPIFEAVGAFNTELQSAGAWVFAGGLAVARHAHAHRGQVQAHRVGMLCADDEYAA